MSRRQPLRRWTGPQRPYDLIFEGTAAVLIVAVLVVAASLLFGSADGGLAYRGGPPSAPGSAFTARYWVRAASTDEHGRTDPDGGTLDFAATVVTELDGSSPTAGYGPPFNTTAGSSQHLGRLALTGLAHQLFGLTQPINTAQDFVLGPVRTLLAPYDPAVAAALGAYQAAGGSRQAGVAADQLDSDQQSLWLKAYTAALGHATVQGGRLQVPAGPYGPVGVLVQADLTLAGTGALDGYLRAGAGQLSTDPFKATMFFSDGQQWGAVARGQGLTGDQWGVMNELWNFPGQFWLVLYAAPYHLPAIAGSTSADLWVGTVIVVVGVLLQLALPWLPGLRDLPRLLPLYKIIYRRYYRRAVRDGAAPGAAGPRPAASGGRPSGP